LPAKLLFGEHHSFEGMAKAARGKPEEVALPIRFPIKVQAGEPLRPIGGSFVFGSRHWYRGQEHQYHRSRRIYDGRIRRNWIGVLGCILLQPETDCGAAEVERNRPGGVRVGANCRRTRAYRQSSGGSCDRGGNAASGSGAAATAPAARVARCGVFDVWALIRRRLPRVMRCAIEEKRAQEVCRTYGAQDS